MASVAVVGGGLAGLASAKAALEYGLTPTVFERAPRPGGLWRPDGGFVWPTLTTNISRFTCTFSDYSWPASTPDFPSAAAVANYLAGYSRDFGVEPYLRTGCEVVGLEQVGPGWRVFWADDGRQRNQWFDAVVVAAGFFAEPVVPRLPGAFRGPVLHSGDYRGPAQFAQFSAGRVVVAGTAFSGSEIAAELASAGVAVTAVTPRPFWLVPRLVPHPGTGHPVPLDLLARTRAVRAGEPEASPPEQNRRRNRFLADVGGNPGRLHSDFFLDPESTDPPHVVVSDGLAGAIQTGGVTLVRGRVTRLESSAVVLEDGRRIHADAIVWCTGFRPRLPFIPDHVWRVAEYDPADLLLPLLLADGVFPAGVGRMYFVGMYRGPSLGTVELQARWACAMIADDLPPPGAADVARGVAYARRVRRMRSRPQFPYDNGALADRIGRALGVLPSAEEHPGTHAWFWNTPVVPAHYRMIGAHSAPAVAARQIDEAAARLQAGTGHE
jgi:dimethylaniline monooxygenase (N-oxide forming)